MAIRVEHQWLEEANAEKAFEYALKQTDHRFKFTRPEAFDELGLTPDDEARAKACSIIARGKQALWADYSGEVVEGIPMTL